jgi:hypothetical protein
MRRSLSDEHVNRNGLVFVQNASPTICRTSGLRFASYYRRVCTRCGFSFAGRRWMRHDHVECDGMRAEYKRDKSAAEHSRTVCLSQRGGKMSTNKSH